jgi:ectoine hydroxylase-related dioxygenase (phytanoyl-CoA dioxygenase family)
VSGIGGPSSPTHHLRTGSMHRSRRDRLRLVSATALDELAEPASLPPAINDRYERDGFVRVPGLLSAETVGAFVPDLADVVAASRQTQVPLAQRSVYGRAFVQEMNLWRRSDTLRQLTFSTRLARAAADVMGVDGVRLYHDQGLVKEPHGGATPWHCDQYYWPLDTDRTVTAWIPLHDIPIEMGPLSFSVGSHRIDMGRTLEIGEQSDRHVRRHPGWRSNPRDERAVRAGDVTFHSGWTFHGAGPNHTDAHRLVFTVIYMADGTRLTEPQTKGQQLDREVWLRSAVVGQPIDTPLNPVLWSR